MNIINIYVQFLDEDLDTDDEILYAGQHACKKDLEVLVKRLDSSNFYWSFKNKRKIDNVVAAKFRNKNELSKL